LEYIGQRTNQSPIAAVRETEGEAIESRLRRTIEGRDAVMRSLVHDVYRFRDATLVDEKKDDFGGALQNLYRDLELSQNLTQ
jgi:hypothetical protein